jgi:hypothetical protein
MLPGQGRALLAHSGSSGLVAEDLGAEKTWFKWALGLGSNSWDILKDSSLDEISGWVVPRYE